MTHKSAMELCYFDNIKVVNVSYHIHVCYVKSKLTSPGLVQHDIEYHNWGNFTLSMPVLIRHFVT